MSGGRSHSLSTVICAPPQLGWIVTPGTPPLMNPSFEETQQSAAPSVRLISRDGLFCAALVMACLIPAWPFAEIGINDDWSYIQTVQVFAQTHHFVYNGWATAMLGWQVLWGSVFA